jgi:hypothetical protein
MLFLLPGHSLAAILPQHRSEFDPTPSTRARGQRFCDCRSCRAGRAALVTHGCAFGGHLDFSVADGRCLAAMHADGERSAFRQMGAMQPAQPAERSRGALVLGRVADVPALCFRSPFVDAR